MGRAVVLAGACLLLANCAGVTFSGGPGPEGLSSPPIYAPRPYLLVVRHGSDSRALEATVIYLPDLAHPRHFRVRTGIGKARLEFALKDGMLVSLNQEGDSRTAEALDALAALLPAAGDAISGARVGVNAARGTPASFELYEIRMDERGTRLVPVEVRAEAGATGESPGR